MREAARKVAGALKGHVADTHANAPRPARGTLIRWEGEDDFAVDVHGTDLILDEEDVTLGQSVRRYDAAVGLEEGDSLAMIEVGEGDFMAVDVESETDETGSG